MKFMNFPGLSRMEPFTDEHLLRVIVETPKGSRNKYDWHEDLGVFPKERPSDRRGGALAPVSSKQKTV